MRLLKLSVLTLVALLTACGGGGGGGSADPVISFNLLSGYKNLIATGASKTFTVSGSCSGTATLTAAPATTQTTFENVAALSRTSVLTMSLTNCTTSASTQTNYYDTNYMPLGSSITGGDYDVWSAPVTMPSSVHVGDTGVLGTINEYASSTKTISVGRSDQSYVIEPDTATTAIVNFVSKSYDASNVLTTTEQLRHRMAADGSLTPISIDLLSTHGSTTQHLLLN